MAERDYYKILGLSRNASQDDIKKAYRRLARKYHPDINPGDRVSEDRFKSLQEAYAVLSDKVRRKAYDQFGDARASGGHHPTPGGGFQGFQGAEQGDFGKGFGGFGDIFSDLFGGRRRQRASPDTQRGDDIEYHLSVPFLEAVRGTRARISFSRQVACRECSGTGSQARSRTSECPACNGKGKVEQRHGTMTFSTNCPHCLGSGRRRVGNCGACAGAGRASLDETLTVRIPAGVNTGSRVRVAGKGNTGLNGGHSGDLYLEVNVQVHDYFRREGKNVSCLIPVSLSEALLGARIEVPTVDGKAWLNVPPGTQSGQKFRLRGRGAPDLKGQNRGDQLVEVKLVLPTIGDQRSRILLKELSELNPQSPRKDMGLR